MNSETGVKRKVMNPELHAWAEAQWGTCDLGNSQRTKRAVEMGMRMAARPGAGLPEQMGDPAMAPRTATLLKGAYRLLNCRAVDIESLWRASSSCNATGCRIRHIQNRVVHGPAAGHLSRLDNVGLQPSSRHTRRAARFRGWAWTSWIVSTKQSTRDAAA